MVPWDLKWSQTVRASVLVMLPSDGPFALLLGFHHRMSQYPILGLNLPQSMIGGNWHVDDNIEW